MDAFRDWQIDPVPGAGVVAIDLFIRDEATATPFHGDGRDFDPSIVGKSSRVRILLDFEQGEARANVFHSCMNFILGFCKSALLIGDYTSRPNLTLHNELAIYNSGDDVRIDYDVVNSISLLGLSVDGHLRIAPGDGGAVEAGYSGDSYPSIEVWHHGDDGNVSMILGDYEAGHAARHAHPTSDRKVGIPVD